METKTQETKVTETETDKRDRDRPASAMDWVIGLAAASLSWAAWDGLARLCGHTQTLDLGLFTFHLSWLTAAMIDIYAMRAFRSWLRSGPWVSASTRTYAKWSTFAAVGVGISGNIAYHVLEVLQSQRAPLWVTVLVSSLAPIALGAIGHLRALERRDRAAWDSRETEETPVRRVSVPARKTPVQRVETAKTESPKIETVRTVETVKTESTPVETPETAEATETAAKVPSLVGRSSLMATRLQMIKDAEPDWAKVGGEISKKRIGEIIGLPDASGTQQKLRDALKKEAALLTTSAPGDARELVGAI